LHIRLRSGTLATVVAGWPESAALPAAPAYGDAAAELLAAQQAGCPTLRRVPTCAGSPPDAPGTRQRQRRCYQGAKSG
jgi:hypothetical protein